LALELVSTSGVHTLESDPLVIAQMLFNGSRAVNASGSGLAETAVVGPSWDPQFIRLDGLPLLGRLGAGMPAGDGGVIAAAAEINPLVWLVAGYAVYRLLR
jgi:hypothetical protein